MDDDLSILAIKEEGNENKLKKKLHPNLPDISTGQVDRKSVV